MSAPLLSISRRTRTTPFTSRVTDSGVSAYTVYNRMLLPTVFESLEADYWHLCEHVQVWDVSAERQVEIRGTDAAKLVQLMTPRNTEKAQIGQCFYLPLCDEHGKLLNDPVGLKLAEDHWWLSLADSDILLWAKGLATGFGLDVNIHEPKVFPLAVQGPKADELMARVFGEAIHDIRFFRFQHLNFNGQSFVVARSGWSKQGGFEIYVEGAEHAEPLWDALFSNGADLNVRAGCPNAIERLESGLLSFGNDMDMEDTPFDCGLDRYVTLNKDINSLSQSALRKIAAHPEKIMIGLYIDQKLTSLSSELFVDDSLVGEIRSHIWSPRHQKHLAAAMCNCAATQGKTELEVMTNEGKLIAQVCAIPFDFDAIGAG